LRWHVRAAHLQYLRNLEVDLADAEDNECTDGLSATLELEADKNDGISCELGICYQTLQSIVSGRKKNHLSIQV
jgi:hypothetical protein